MLYALLNDLDKIDVNFVLNDRMIKLEIVALNIKVFYVDFVDFSAKTGGVLSGFGERVVAMHIISVIEGEFPSIRPTRGVHLVRFVAVQFVKGLEVAGMFDWGNVVNHILSPEPLFVPEARAAVYPLLM